MAVNIRQLRNELNATSDQMTAAGRSLGIDVSNYGRNLSAQEEQRLRQYFTGGQQQAAQQAPAGQSDGATVMQEINAFTDEFTTTLGLFGAASLKDAVIGKMIHFANTMSTDTAKAALAAKTNQPMANRDWTSDVVGAYLAPLAQGFNESIAAYSLTPGRELNPFLPSQNLSMTSLPSAAESESSAAPVSSPTSVELPQASESSSPQS